MCGIAGVVSRVPVQNRELLQCQRDTMCHRGPDDAGLWWSPDGTVGLAQRRLAIVDLSPGGHQPMADASNELHVVLNGEIYNFREIRSELAGLGHSFRSQSDTEVLLEAYREWGTGCLQRLVGMFAFALYDSRRRVVFCARDRAGEKPFFYRYSNGTLSFASELKALLLDPTAPRVMSAEALDHYIGYGYVPAPLCLVEGFRKLPPAHFFEHAISGGEPVVKRYWSLPEPLTGEPAEDEELVEELHGLLRNSVKQQLLADVPVGVLLSGGLDSSLITAMAAEASSVPVKTFTISFPGHGVFDEGPYAKMVASHFGTEHTDLVAEPATIELLSELVRQYDEPINDSSMVPTYMVSKLVRQKCKVALGGDGGDELFGGYHQYSYMLRQQQLHRRIPSMPRKMIAGIAGALPVGIRGRTYLMSIGAGRRESIAYAGMQFDGRARRNIVPALRSRRWESPELARSGRSLGSDTTIQRMTRTDFSNYLPEDILVKVDRASMLTSLEVRAPFLDHRIIEFAFGRLADDQRATVNAKKVILKKLGKAVLPKELDLDRKQGFSLPLAAWFKGPWGEFMESVLREAPAELYAPAAIDTLLRNQKRGFSNAQRLFGLTFLELWRREYRIELPDSHRPEGWAS